jgi:beta-glucosidase
LVDVLQINLTFAEGNRTLRLAGFQRIELKPGKTRQLANPIEPPVIGQFSEVQHNCIEKGGRYKFSIGISAATLLSQATIDLQQQRLKP